MKWFTSDLHFAHPFVAALRGYALPGYARDESIKQQAEHDGRQLKDCVDWRKHDADIVQAINTYVGREDELYILGDISSGSTWSVDQAIMRIQNLQVPRKRRHLILLATTNSTHPAARWKSWQACSGKSEESASPKSETGGATIHTRHF